MDTRTYNPPATRRETVVDSLHGQEIADDYRWLEDSDSTEVVAWIAEQNAHTRSILDHIPNREQLTAEMREMMTVAYLGTPEVRGERLFYTRRAEGQDQIALYVREGVDGNERVLLDPASGSQRATVALDWWYPSQDGKLLAYGYSDHGDEKSTLYVLDVDSGEQLRDVIPDTRYASVAWQPDSKVFYYTRYPALGSVPAGEEDYHQHVFYHRLGDDWQSDLLLFGDGRDMEDVPAVDLSPNGRWLLVSVFVGWTKSELFVRDLSQPDSAFQQLPTGDALYSGEMYGEQLYLLTNEDAPNYRLFVVDLTHPQRENWREIIAEREDTRIAGFKVVGGRLAVDELHNVVGTVSIYSQDGKGENAVSLPPRGSVSGLSGEQSGSDIYITYESYTMPPTIYRYQLADGTTSVWAQAQSPFDLSDIEVQQVQYRSKDGTQVPLFIVAHKGIARNGKNPTVLSGYGGFDVSRTPIFTRAAVPWLRRGGIYAVANLRGGGEFGEAWHKAGRLELKQNVFDDFIGAAEYLISAGYTNPEHLAIEGRSNGGLLTGAAITQRPELFRAALVGVPLLDMVRYHLYRIARLWVPEYGDPEDVEHFPFLYEYSPYHKIKQGTAYPATLLYTATSDSRVDPMHARKMAAALQAANSSPYPILLREEEEAGHGIGKPLYKQVEEYTDMWGFVFDQLGVEI